MMPLVPEWLHSGRRAIPEPIVPNIKAAEKWQRQTERRAKRNLDVKTRLKTLFRKAKSNPEQASTVEAQFDKAARKGIIHPNKAARKKSRLVRAIRAVASAAAAAAANPAAAAPRKRATAKKK
jgi:small subunit ribosomal protein S20